MMGLSEKAPRSKKKLRVISDTCYQSAATTSRLGVGDPVHHYHGVDVRLARSPVHQKDSCEIRVILREAGDSAGKCTRAQDVVAGKHRKRMGGTRGGMLRCSLQGASGSESRDTKACPQKMPATPVDYTTDPNDAGVVQQVQHHDISLGWNPILTEERSCIT